MRQARDRRTSAGRGPRSRSRAAAIEARDPAAGAAPCWHANTNAGGFLSAKTLLSAAPPGLPGAIAAEPAGVTAYDADRSPSRSMNSRHSPFDMPLSSCATASPASMRRSTAIAGAENWQAFRR